jgi:CheY-like chemotaxis protein
MPAMDGFELIGAVRADPRFVRLPVVVLSGDTDPRTPERLRALGVDAYFPKPYSPAEVRRKVEELIHASRP